MTNRQPKGQPVGGQFAAHEHTAAAEGLLAETAAREQHTAAAHRIAAIAAEHVPGATTLEIIRMPDGRPRAGFLTNGVRSDLTGKDQVVWAAGVDRPIKGLDDQVALLNPLYLAHGTDGDRRVERLDLGAYAATGGDWLFEKCGRCWLFVEENEAGDDVAAYVHLVNDENAEAVAQDNNHEATASGEKHTLDEWKRIGPAPMLRAFSFGE